MCILEWNCIMTNVMHKFLIYLSIYFCLTCFGLSFSPSSEASVQLRQWFKSPEYGVSARALLPHTLTMDSMWVSASTTCFIYLLPPRLPPPEGLRLFFEPNLFTYYTPLSQPQSHFTPTRLWRWNRQSVPKRWHLNYRRRRITQKKGYSKSLFTCMDYLTLSHLRLVD
jgi:hypothetical protein